MMNTRMMRHGLAARRPAVWLTAAVLTAALATHASAEFHLMQIQQVVGGVNGDTTAQAIQLRMRAFGQNFITGSRLIAYDANGENPVELIVFDRAVSNSARGAKILVVSARFVNLTTPTTVPDFIMTNLIPASYLATGRITFEDDFGTVYWSISFGGDNYLGSNLGSRDNDDDGDFGPPITSALPSTSDAALLFQGPAAAKSTTNIHDFRLSGRSAVWTNNAGATFVLGDGATFDVQIVGVDCPGEFEVVWSGASANGPVAILFASNVGSFVVPGGQLCAGTVLGLGRLRLQLIDTAASDGNGIGTFGRIVSSPLACGGYVQLVDITTCETSNLVILP